MSFSEPQLVKFLAALTFNSADSLKDVKQDLTGRYGNIDFCSQLFDFSYTQYYEKEMGLNLKKQFLSFDRLQMREALIDFKRFAGALEEKFARDGKRTVNIDPAYMELAKIVVASHKNFDHRIYLATGVYGDVQLRFRHGRYVSNEWTYPDYSSEIALRFFSRVRKSYSDRLKKNE